MNERERGKREKEGGEREGGYIAFLPLILNKVASLLQEKEVFPCWFWFL